MQVANNSEYIGTKATRGIWGILLALILLLPTVWPQVLMGFAASPASRTGAGVSS